MSTIETAPAHSPGVASSIERGRHRIRAEEARRNEMRAMRFDTIAVHGIYDAQAALSNQGSINEPMFLSPAQHFADADEMEAALAYLVPSWTYTRIANPTVHYLEETLALLETYGSDLRASAGATASGMAAVSMATEPFLVAEPSLPPPNIVASAKCYGGTFMLFSKRYGGERGVDVRWVRDRRDVEHGLPLVVDPTVATPALLRPLCMGADVVVHSLSKGMAGSGLVIAGALVSRRAILSRVGPDELRDDLATHVKLLPFRDHGPAISPFNAMIALSDVRTVRSRMDGWSRGAMAVASFLDEHPNIERVGYPGLRSFPGHELARRDLWLVDGDEEGRPANRYGSLLAFDVRGGAEAARRVFDRLRLVWRATDLGRIKSVATIPAISTHQQQGNEGRELAGVPENQIRLSVGGEHPDDVIADLDRALG